MSKVPLYACAQAAGRGSGHDRRGGEASCPVNCQLTRQSLWFFFLFLSSLELSVTKVYEPQGSLEQNEFLEVGLHISDKNGMWGMQVHRRPDGAVDMTEEEAATAAAKPPPVSTCPARCQIFSSSLLLSSPELSDTTLYEP